VHDLATITVARRRGGYRDRLRSYRIGIDERVRGRLRAGQEISVIVEPGKHTIVMRIDWSGSQKKSVTVGAGETLILRCRPGRAIRAWEALTDDSWIFWDDGS